MKTLRRKVDINGLHTAPVQAMIEEAANVIRAGGLVVFPTETVYGLGANALSASSVEKIFHAKQRPSWDPLIVHIADTAMLSKVVAAPLSHSARLLAEAFWPGPLTLLLPKASSIPDGVTAGRSLVGVRIPAHPVARALILAAGVPIAAPSANSFGRISPTLAIHVLEDLDGRIDMLLDSGETLHGVESTVVDVAQDPVVLYRHGAIPIEDLRRVYGKIEDGSREGNSARMPEPPESLPSPGLGIRHYAPKARLVPIEEEWADLPEALYQAVQDAAAVNKRLGVMLPSGFLSRSLPALPNVLVFDWGDWTDLPMLAHRLFAGLRCLDAEGVEIILCPVPQGEGIGAAIRDRLFKASRKT
ncbi:TsaC protein (YrdC domain) required for threonylcarbamoyladenosine t(6)A37 modification in tRNA [Acidisarcina polymorpha]|uniref:Threonylcarbamoyl-AMP synthase n=1 Tax=Acidisarcina polymorpha TaxID=2211140 RepID=A0A2Z5G0N4_9BACT|nr:L-threonylcarbamoyladenylate synthase [Acidisarcina polymorpha]AXC12560.1 TsaC protein (YrdC domain) required for threonylcarbamoyladenosine t(6)A37 modification in tRNA [Acidisarcina polymorpha]